MEHIHQFVHVIFYFFTNISQILVTCKTENHGCFFVLSLRICLSSFYCVKRFFLLSNKVNQICPSLSLALSHTAHVLTDVTHAMSHNQNSLFFSCLTTKNKCLERKTSPNHQHASSQRTNIIT